MFGRGYRFWKGIGGGGDSLGGFINYLIYLCAERFSVASLLVGIVQ